MGWFWAALSLIIFLSLLQQLLRKKIKNLPPSPLVLPVIGHLHLLGQNLHHNFHLLAQKHGPIVFLSLGSVSAIVVSSASAAELVLKKHDLNFAVRPHHLNSCHVGYDQKSILFAPYGAYWRNMRKLATVKLLSHAKINALRPIRRAEAEEMVGTLRRAAEKRGTVKVSETVSYVIVMQGEA